METSSSSFFVDTQPQQIYIEDFEKVVSAASKKNTIMAHNKNRTLHDTLLQRALWNRLREHLIYLQSIQ